MSSLHGYEYTKIPATDKDKTYPNSYTQRVPVRSPAYKDSSYQHAPSDAGRGRGYYQNSGEAVSSQDQFTDLIKLSNSKARAIRTGRQRKKTAARSKGGEFQAKRKKKRLYFCCVSDDIDMDALIELFQEPQLGFHGNMYDRVLHLFREAEQHTSNPKNLTPVASQSPVDGREQLVNVDLPDLTSFRVHSPGLDFNQNLTSTDTGATAVNTLEIIEEGRVVEFDKDSSLAALSAVEPLFPEPLAPPPREGHQHASLYGSMDEERGAIYRQDSESEYEPIDYASDTSAQSAATIPPMEDPSSPAAAGGTAQTGYGEGIGGSGELDGEIKYRPVVGHTTGQEVFIFDFGAAVFWGLSQDSVQEVLDIIRNNGVKTLLSSEEFEAGEDDMAFVESTDSETINIANDVLVLPLGTTVKNRLALSYAIAQSAVLSIFEARIEKRIEDYKYIPECLAQSGRVNLTPKRLGNMIGDVFKLSHDLNLHSEILDLPDYFWNETAQQPLYRLCERYMEMEERTLVLNKRLDLMRELLEVLQQQHETAHSVKLEWIVIWLIVVSVVLEICANVNEYLNRSLKYATAAAADSA